MDQCSPFDIVYLNQVEVMIGELRQYILQTRTEIEATVMGAKQEILKKEEEIRKIKELLMMTIQERNEAQSKIQKLVLEKLLLQQLLHQQQREIQHQHETHSPQQKTANLSNTNATTNYLSGSCSESDDSSIISSPCASVSASVAAKYTIIQPPPLTLNPTSSGILPRQMAALLNGSVRPLPEKGKLLKAVMEGGPLLQTLMLAGPLPQWQHPPPRLNSIEIPPVSINLVTKRGIQSANCSVASSPKYQRLD